MNLLSKVLSLVGKRETMAYLRKEKEIVEVDFPTSKVWVDLAKAATRLEWTVEESDEKNHQMKIKTKSNFMAYASLLVISAVPMNENATKVTISAETPVTTITGLFDIGRTAERIDTFLRVLHKQVNDEAADPAQKETE
jgi:hypothetical protein